MSEELMRLIEVMSARQRRLFACNIAEHVIHLFENEFPEDDAPKKGIAVARAYADGQVSIKELNSARARFNSVPDQLRAARQAQYTVIGALWHPMYHPSERHLYPYEGLDPVINVADAALKAVFEAAIADGNSFEAANLAKQAELEWQVLVAKSILDEHQ